MKNNQIGATLRRTILGMANATRPTMTFRRDSRFRAAKRWAGVLLVVFLALASSQADLLTYDGFNYYPVELEGQNGYTNYWTTYWGQFLGDQTTYGVTNVALSDPSGLLYTTPNSVFTTGGFQGRFFTNGNGWAYLGSTNYWSILIRPNNTPTSTNYYGLQIFSNNQNTGNGVDLFVGKTGDGPNWGMQAGEGTNAFSSVPATANQTVLLVVRVVFSSQQFVPDVFNLYVNPTPGNPEPVTPDATITNDIGTQNGIALNTGNGGAASFAQIRIGSTFASVTPTTSTIDPNIRAYEPFDYSNIQTLDGLGGGYGWDNVSWGQGLGGATSYSITAGSLTDPSGLLVTSGNKVTTTGGDAGRWNLFPGFGTPGSTAYWSVLIRPENTPNTTNYYGLDIYASAGDAGVIAGKNGSGLNWGLEAGPGTDAYSSVACVLSQTVFLVVRGDFGSSSDTFRLYVNPTPGAPEPATADATLSDFIGTQNGISFTTGNGGAASFDEIRIGTNYADVTPSVPVIVTNAFNIVSIAVTNTVPYPGIFLKWATTGGNTNVVQATSGANGSYNTNGFANISAQMVIPGSGVVTQSFTDASAATNRPARYYRVLQVP